MRSVLFLLFYGFSFLSLTYSQVEPTIFEDDFSEGMGLWVQGKDATIVNHINDEDEKSLLLQKGIGNNNSDFDSPNPHLTSELLDLSDYCSVHLSFELLALGLNSDVRVFLEVSDNTGESFQV